MWTMSHLHLSSAMWHSVTAENSRSVVGSAGLRHTLWRNPPEDAISGVGPRIAVLEDAPCASGSRTSDPTRPARGVGPLIERRRGRPIGFREPSKRPQGTKISYRELFRRHQETKISYRELFRRHQETKISYRKLFRRHQGAKISYGKLFRRPQGTKIRCREPLGRPRGTKIRCREPLGRPRGTKIRCREPLGRPQGTKIRCRKPLGVPIGPNGQPGAFGASHGDTQRVSPGREMLHR